MAKARSAITNSPMRTTDRRTKFNFPMKTPKSLLLGMAIISTLTLCAAAEKESGFVSLFDGESLKGWTLVNQRGAGYGVTNGVIYCARGGGGNLFTEKEYSDFIL